jgi:hypothetical protein
MKPDWDKLMAEYKGHDSILIADVDCTAGGKSLCETVGVEGFPTIKYGDANDLENYEEGRDFKSLSKFAKEKLGPRCSPGNLDLCTAERKTQIEEFMKMDADALGKKIAEDTAAIKQVDADAEAFLKSLQDQLEKKQKEADESKKTIKESGLGLMKSVAAHRKIKIGKEEEL